MPLPPRPIPSHHHRHHNHQRIPTARPGSAVPRKSPGAQSQLALADWRAEMALLPETHPRSAPGGPSVAPTTDSWSKSLGSGGACFQENTRKGDGEQAGSLPGRHEVGLERLIKDGRGKREKRDTTARTLGFDFIPNPSVITLPDRATSPGPGGSAKNKSLLATALSTNPGPASDAAGSTPLAQTPTTPALLAAQSYGDDDDQDYDDEDWERVSVSVSHAERGDDEEERDENICSDGEEDVIVLGEMELEDELDRLRIDELAGPEPYLKTRARTKGASGKKTAQDRPSYAAALFLKT